MKVYFDFVRDVDRKNSRYEIPSELNQSLVNTLKLSHKNWLKTNSQKIHLPSHGHTEYMRNMNLSGCVRNRSNFALFKDIIQRLNHEQSIKTMHQILSDVHGQILNTHSRTSKVTAGRQLTKAPEKKIHFPHPEFYHNYVPIYKGCKGVHHATYYGE
jgi:hypothetical protein